MTRSVLILLAASLTLQTGCAVVTVVDTAVDVTATTVGAAADVTGAVVGGAVDLVKPDDDPEVE